jgi:hypothetical protein
MSAFSATAIEQSERESIFSRNASRISGAANCYVVVSETIRLMEHFY